MSPSQCLIFLIGINDANNDLIIERKNMHSFDKSIKISQVPIRV